MPKVSVIIPVYNTAPYLRRCLDSVCGQTLRDIEIICVDDGSTDNSLEILRDWQSRDARIRLIELGTNQGSSVARNAGLAIACGEYIGFIDSDDFIDLDYYKKLFYSAYNNMSDISRAVFLPVDIEYTSNNIDKYQIIEKNKKLMRFEINRNELLKRNKSFSCYGFTTCIFRNNLIKDNNIIFPERLNNFEDVVFLVQCAYYANKISIIDSAYYYYCLRKNSNSRRTNTYEVLKMVADSSKIIMDFLNTHDYDKYSYMYISRCIIDSIKSLQVKTKLDIFLIEKILLILKMNKFLLEDRSIRLLFIHFLLKKKLMK